MHSVELAELFLWRFFNTLRSIKLTRKSPDYLYVFFAAYNHVKKNKDK